MWFHVKSEVDTSLIDATSVDRLELDQGTPPTQDMERNLYLNASLVESESSNNGSLRMLEGSRSSLTDGGEAVVSESPTSLAKVLGYKHPDIYF